MLLLLTSILIQVENCRVELSVMNGVGSGFVYTVHKDQ